MKKIEKLSLNHLSSKEMPLNEMNKIKGGSACYCGCCYSGSGGSSFGQNGYANCTTNPPNPCQSGTGTRVSC